MSKPVPQRRKSGARWRDRRIFAMQRARVPGRPLLRAQETGALRAWAAATRARKAVQRRIVWAFRKYVEGAGPGPADGDLLLFARLALAEQRLRRGHVQAKALRCCGSAQAFGGPASAFRRGEPQ